MKNKLKKSKIIVPALALITATTAASVTGTVAWFTATRAVTVTASTFETRAENSSLSVTTTANADAGTASVTGNTKAISVVDNLTHGSYNAAKNNTGILYSPVIEDDASVTGYNALGTVANHTETASDGTTATKNKWLAFTDSSSKKVWYGVSWTMTFSQDEDPNGYKNYLLFNPITSEIKESDSSTPTTENQTLPGFRVAFMTATKCIVVGGDSAQKHVTGTTSSDTSEKWSDGTVYTTFKATNITKAADYSTTLSSDTMNLGEIDSKDGLVVTAVAWFEGEDTTYITTKLSDGTTDRIMSKVEASFDFYSRKA